MKGPRGGEYNLVNGKKVYVTAAQKREKLRTTLSLVHGIASLGSLALGTYASALHTRHNAERHAPKPLRLPAARSTWEPPRQYTTQGKRPGRKAKRR
jgi:hypothetical protein